MSCTPELSPQARLVPSRKAGTSLLMSGGRSFSVMSWLKASCLLAMVAPALTYSSSCSSTGYEVATSAFLQLSFASCIQGVCRLTAKRAAAPASASTTTPLKPALRSAAAPAGVSDTRASP